MLLPTHPGAEMIAGGTIMSLDIFARLRFMSKRYPWRHPIAKRGGQRHGKAHKRPPTLSII